MSNVLLRNGVIQGPEPATAIAFVDGRVAFIGTDDSVLSYDGADVVIDLAGAFVAPAFVDAHVHTVQSGFQLTQLDLRGTTSVVDALDRVAAYSADLGPDAIVVGAGWEETDWPEGRPPTTEELDRAADGRRVYLDRRDGHSSVVSPALIRALPGLSAIDGFESTGRVERDARHAVSDALAELIGPDQRLEAARVAIASMAANGMAAFHENAAPHIGPEYELDLVRQAAREAGLVATLYWGELGAFDKAASLDVVGLAGDLNADGAIGSRTAALRSAYDDQDDHCGHAYLTAEQIGEHVIGCTERGLQAGFHCIGDLSLDAITDGFRFAEKRLGTEAIQQGRHRLEHVEMPSPDAIRMMSDLNVTASVQPLFDEAWGGPNGMYAKRLGERWREMNPFLDMSFATVPLAFGSDSPVTDLAPWQAIRAASHHNTPGQSLSTFEAFKAHTSGGWKAARVDDAGTFSQGARASYAVWDVPAGLIDGLPDLRPGAHLPTCLKTVVDGRTVFEAPEVSQK